MNDISPGSPTMSLETVQIAGTPVGKRWANPWANLGQTLGKPLYFLGKPLFDAFFGYRKTSTELAFPSDQVTLL